MPAAMRPLLALPPGLVTLRLDSIRAYHANEDESCRRVSTAIRIGSIDERSEVMITRLSLGLLCVGLLAEPLSAADKEKEKPSAEEVKKAEKLVNDRLGELKAEGGKVDRITEDAVD